MRINYFAIIFLILISSCGTSQDNKSTKKNKLDKPLVKQEIIAGAEQSELYLDLLKNKKVALVVNQSSLVKKQHLLDFLLEKKVNVVKIFAPEHGFRGNEDRGKHISNDIDKKTGIPIISMFGKNRRPQNKQLQDIDIVIFDIQDAGARFFTYISSMHEVMEACAINNKLLIVLDRPNPLGDYIDGPIRQEQFKSFVGMHAIPIVHGLTVGELAQMINGEGWLENKNKCKLKIIKVKNYDHSMQYNLPVKPSPNLPNQLSIRLYPSLCFFEATNISIGRGTKFPFQVVAYPDKIFGDSLFIPKDIKGMQLNPIQEGKVCYGVDLRSLQPKNQKFTLKYIINFYQKSNFKDKFFSRERWFKLLSGNDILINQIKNGLSEEEIKKTWKKELTEYKLMRKKYLLYKDFE